MIGSVSKTLLEAIQLSSFKMGNSIKLAKSGFDKLSLSVLLLYFQYLPNVFQGPVPLSKKDSLALFFFFFFFFCFVYSNKIESCVQI